MKMTVRTRVQLSPYLRIEELEFELSKKGHTVTASLNGNQIHYLTTLFSHHTDPYTKAEERAWGIVIRLEQSGSLEQDDQKWLIGLVSRFAEAVGGRFRSKGPEYVVGMKTAPGRPPDLEAASLGMAMSVVVYKLMGFKTDESILLTGKFWGFGEETVRKNWQKWKKDAQDIIHGTLAHQAIEPSELKEKNQEELVDLLCPYRDGLVFMIGFPPMEWEDRFRFTDPDAASAPARSKAKKTRK